MIGVSAKKCCYKTSISYVPKKGTCDDYEQGHVVPSAWRSKYPYAIGLIKNTTKDYCFA